MPSDPPSLRWSLDTGMRAAFSTRVDGRMRDAGNRQRFLASLGLDQVFVPEQVHGIQVATIPEESDLSAADGLVARRPIPPLAVYGADCPGLILIASDAVGIAHCGWRSTAAGMASALVAALAGLSRQPVSTWSAFIGPRIAGDHYEVDAPVLHSRSWPASALRPGRDPAHARLDLATTLTHDLQRLGVLRCRDCQVDTAHHPALHSHRHHGPGMNQMLVVWEGV